MPTHHWSEQQIAIFMWFKAGRSNLVVRARAGTGKTTTIIHAIGEAPEQRILLAAFNKKIADELAGKLANPYAEAKTLHGVGFAIVKRFWSDVRVDSDRGYRLARAAVAAVKVNAEGKVDPAGKLDPAGGPDEIATLVAKLAARAKGMLPRDGEALALIAEEADLIPEAEFQAMGWTLPVVVACAFEAMKLAQTRDGSIDFDDMIFLPIAHGWVSPKYDLVVIDEAQDMNAAQLALAKGVCSPKGRIAVVGDDRQAIYGFRGADSEAIDRMKVELQASELGLTVTYRCPRSIVALAQVLVPDYIAAPTAPAGEVRGTREAPAVSLEGLVQQAEPNDFVLSRKNAPLMSVCLRLLRSGKRAKIEGKDIGRALKTIASKLKARSIPEFLAKLTAWEGRQADRARAQASSPEKAEAKIQTLADQADTLRAAAEGASGVPELMKRLDDLFGDQVGGAVVCSSIHRAKGRETETVFVLADTLYPGGRKGIEESNLEYVAVSRAKQTLVWASSQ